MINFQYGYLRVLKALHPSTDSELNNESLPSLEVRIQGKLGTDTGKTRYALASKKRSKSPYIWENLTFSKKHV